MSPMAEKVPYPFMSSNDMQSYLVERLLYRFRNEDNNELTLKIETAYKKLFGYPMLPMGAHVENVCLHGTPGVGKTSAIRSAAKQVADLLGMKLKMDPVPPYVPQPNDLVMVTLEMSGEVSNIILGGIPVADSVGTNDKVQFMNKLPLYQLVILGKATAGLLIMDDFVNAAPSVQNSALSVALEGRFQTLQLGNTYVALTANLGSLDNSDVSPLSDPMTARIGHFYVEDNVVDFANRMGETYKDSIADAGVIGYLKQRTDHFMLDVDSDDRQPRNGLRTPFPCSRSWQKLINELRILTNRLGTEITTGPIQNLAAAFVGSSVATSFAAYQYARLTGAEPMAKRLIETGVFDDELFIKNYGAPDKRGLSAEAQSFGYQLAFSLANHATAALAAGKDFNETMNRYRTGLLKLDEPTITLSVSEFGGRITHLLPDWCVKGQDGKPAYMNQEYVDKVSLKLFETREVSQALGKAMTHALVAADDKEGYSSNVSRRIKNPPKKSPAP